MKLLKVGCINKVMDTEFLYIYKKKKKMTNQAQNKKIRKINIFLFSIVLNIKKCNIKGNSFKHFLEFSK